MFPWPWGIVSAETGDASSSSSSSSFTMGADENSDVSLSFSAVVVAGERISALNKLDASSAAEGAAGTGGGGYDGIGGECGGGGCWWWEGGGDDMIDSLIDAERCYAVVTRAFNDERSA